MLLTVSLVALCALVGLGVDGGNLYLHRRAMQNAADAGAFAAARLLSLTPAVRDSLTIRQAIDGYATKNYVSNPVSDVTSYWTNDIGDRISAFTSGSGPAPAEATGVEIVATRDVQTFFLPIVGYGTLHAAAIAAARGKPGTNTVQDAFTALDSDSTASALDLGGSGFVINGNVHSNATIKFGGGSNLLNGVAEYRTGAPDPGGKWTLDPSTNNPVQSAALSDPVNKSLSDFYQGTSSTSTYHYVSGNTDLGSFVHSGVLDSGIYYVDGDVQTSSTALSTAQASNVTIVSTGLIKINWASVDFKPYSQGMLFFGGSTGGASTDGVKIAANTGSWEGLVYAPGARINLSGTSAEGSGALVGLTIKTGGGLHFSFDSQYLQQPTPAQIILYK